MGKKIIVIGGGAAGMMAAYAASLNNADVLLIEKNEKLGKKVYITGKGRCNLTNACEREDFFSSVIRNPKFLYSSFSHFDNFQMMELLEQNGCPLKTERGNRVFPVSDRSSDVIGTLEKILKKSGVNILKNTTVRSLCMQDEKISGVITQTKTYPCDAVIMATGGISYPATGSDGQSFKIAKDFGHHTTELKPSLVPLDTQETYPSMMQGLSLKNVEITVTKGKKKIYKGFGEMLFTHFGVSGPLILTASSYLSRFAKGEMFTTTNDVLKYGVSYEEQRKADRTYPLEDGPFYLSIDLKPAVSKEELEKRILKEFTEYPNRRFKTVLSGLLPGKMIDVMPLICDIDKDRPIHRITKEERSRLIDCIKAMSFTIKGLRGMTEAIITNGGISVKEIDPSTMASKLVDGLYFAGEMIDVDALTGGYNLQIAWSTGYLAGESAAKKAITV